MTAKILCLDIERQSALVDGIWEPGDKRFIGPHQIVEPARTICFAYQWISGFHNTDIQFVAEWEGNKPQDNCSATPGGGHEIMIQKGRDLMHEADFIVGWNSRKFDVQHLRGGRILYNIPPPSPHIDIDLMLQFRGQANAMYYRLGVLAKQLGLDGGKMEVDGALWRKLRFAQGDVLRRARRKMKAYNITDVKRTTEAYYRLRPELKGLNLPLYEDPTGEGSDELRCTNCKSFNLRREGTRKTQARAYQRYACRDCNKWMTSTKSVFTTGTRGI